MAPREELLVHTMVALADTLVDDFDIVDLTATLADSCVEILDVAGAGILLASGSGGLHVMAASTGGVHDLEELQTRTDEGPCPDCFRTGAPIVNADLTVDRDRWPTFTPAALAAGFRSAHAVPMRLRGTVIGALNLFRTAPGHLDDPDVVAAQALADIATVAVLQHRGTAEAQVLNDQLSHALDNRVTIEQAKGFLAEQADITVDDAFELLRAHARSRNRKLLAVAEDVVGGRLGAAALRPARRGAPDRR